jgi:UDP-glucose 4-epimerase
VRKVATLVTAAWPKKANLSFDGKSRSGNPFSLIADDSEMKRLGFAWTIPPDAGIRDYVRWFLSAERAAM